MRLTEDQIRMFRFTDEQVMLLVSLGVEIVAAEVPPPGLSGARAETIIMDRVTGDCIRLMPRSEAFEGSWAIPSEETLQMMEANGWAPDNAFWRARAAARRRLLETTAGIEPTRSPLGPGCSSV